jgi:hypothetical protein
MDRDGYPDDSELDSIRAWGQERPPGYVGLMEFVQGLWRFPDYFQACGRHYALSTGGWSGNEELIGALQDNHAFWACCWASSRRGGHYVFEIPEGLR